MCILRFFVYMCVEMYVCKEFLCLCREIVCIYVYREVVCVERCVYV